MVRRNDNRRTHVGSVGGSETDICHDGNHHVFLHVEPSGVKTPGMSKGGKFGSRKDLLQEFTRRESTRRGRPSVGVRTELDRTRRDVQQLGDVSTNADTRVANAEELIDESTSTDEDGADNPGTERASGHIGIIVVVDDSADFGVWRVLDGPNQTLVNNVRTGLKLTTMMRAASTLSSW